MIKVTDIINYVTENGNNYSAGNYFQSKMKKLKNLPFLWFEINKTKITIYVL